MIFLSTNLPLVSGRSGSLKAGTFWDYVVCWLLTSYAVSVCLSVTLMDCRKYLTFCQTFLVTGTSKPHHSMFFKQNMSAELEWSPYQWCHFYIWYGKTVIFDCYHLIASYVLETMQNSDSCYGTLIWSHVVWWRWWCPFVNSEFILAYGKLLQDHLSSCYNCLEN